MCSVIGIKLKNPNLDLVREIFLQSRIRGMHATGITYYKNKKLHTIKDPIPADKFINKYDFSEFVDNDQLRLIGHCRYSTSDLEYNQPMTSKNFSIVHNGVVTQELPENWNTLYDVSCETKNDSELLVHTLENGEDPLEKWKNSSISMVSIDSSGNIMYTRNGKRPLWVWKSKKDFIVTSTRNIAIRAGLYNPKRVDYNGNDLQPFFN